MLIRHQSSIYFVFSMRRHASREFEPDGFSDAHCECVRVEVVVLDHDIANTG